MKQNENSVVKWGILGTGNIAARFLQACPHVTAVAGHTLHKGMAFAASHNIRNFYASYDELIAHADIDALYIALPHALHKEYAVKAMRKGIAILVEKPLAMSQKEASEIKAVSEETGVLCMEAMKEFFQPVSQKISELLPKIGPIKRIETRQAFAIPKEKYGKSYHTTKESGGCLLDCGCYGLAWISRLIKDNIEILDVKGNLYQDIDIYVDALMQAGHTEIRHIAGFDRQMPSVLNIEGAHGTLTISPMHRPDKIEVHLPHAEPDTIAIPYENDMRAEISHFESLVTHGAKLSDIMPLQESVSYLSLLNELRKMCIEKDADDLTLLEAQETAAEIDDFNAAKALAIGNAIIACCQKYDRGILIRIIRESDQMICFQYAMDDKDAHNIQYLDGKYEAIRQFGHSSAWLYVKKTLDPDFDSKNAIPSGGAFPLYNSHGKIVASILVSGLHEGNDHTIIINGLNKALGKNIPSFRKVLR